MTSPAIYRFLGNVAALAYRELAVIRHDRAFLSMIFLQPIMMFALFAFVLSNKPQNVPWALLDRSQSEASRRLVREIQADGSFLAPEIVAGYGDGRRLLRSQAALALLVIPKRFAADLERGHGSVQLLLDGSDPLAAARVGGTIGEIAGAFTRPRDAAFHHASFEPRSRPGGIRLQQRFWFNATLRDREFFLPALAGMLLTNICLSAMSLSLVGERESGTYEQTLSLPTTGLEIVLGKLVPYVGVSYIVMLIAVVAPGLVFGQWPQGSWIALVLATLPFVLASLAIGVFVSTVARTSAQAVFITVFFIMPSFVLSGVMLPYQLMPDGVRHVGGALPLRWYQIALRRIIERGAGLFDVGVPVLALFAIFTVLLALISWRLKPRLA